jgi:hypothetical protein
MLILKLILKKFSFVVLIPLLVGIAVVGAGTGRTVYQALRYTPPQLLPDKERGDNLARQRFPFERYAAIERQGLFAAVAAVAEERAEAVTGTGTPATTAAPFKLKGTIVVIPSGSSAIVEDMATRKEELVHERDMVQGYRIVRILRNKMIVDRNGYEQVMEIIEEQEKTAPGARGPIQRPTPPRAPVRSPLPVTVPPPPGQVAR